ncbi:MAG: carbon storage regulator CsrA [Synergistaceae bacterium]|jgi:carbon storage regulator|nr:carbon storage regulator CsrA [Synergistaceae bacterium]
MLVLSRKPGEALRVGDDVEITIVEVKGDMVRLGIDAPRNISVWRKELWLAIVEENKKAAEEASTDVTVELPVVPSSSPVKTVKVTDLLVKKKK